MTRETPKKCPTKRSSPPKKVKRAKKTTTSPTTSKPKTRSPRRDSTHRQTDRATEGSETKRDSPEPNSPMREGPLLNARWMPDGGRQMLLIFRLVRYSDGSLGVELHRVPA